MNTKKVTVYNYEQYYEIDAPLQMHIEKLNKILGDIPIEYRDSAVIKIEPSTINDYGDEVSTVITTVTYTRPKTQEEIDEVIKQEEVRRLRLIKHYEFEIQQLKRKGESK